MKWTLAVLAMLAAACGGDDSNGPAQVEAEGSWSGSINNNGGTQIGTMTLTLTETGGTVSGTGNLASSDEGIAVSASGTYSQPSLSLNLAATGFETVNLTATVGEGTMTGTLNGSGFVNSAIT